MSRLLVLMATAALLHSAELPVRTVILYKHGVGYFERSGELRSGESARLDFNASDMNDVLKSLTIDDKSGGKITGLRYDASEPLEKRLADYPFQVEPQTAMSRLLDQLKGARLELKTAQGESVAGAIVTARSVAIGEKSQEKEMVTLLLDSGEMRTYELANVVYLKLADEALQRQMKEYLSVLAVARSKEKRSVYIDSTDARARQVTASYMTPTPVWKSSYRLIMKDAETMIEGWAIVDNTSGEDWTKVNLALVSGRPISFISRLYEPRYRVRRVAELAEEETVGPQVFSGAVQTELFKKAPAPPPPMAAAAPRNMRGQMIMAADAVQERAETSSVAVTTQGREVGELFEYRFGNPVTVKKGESAMLPFLQQKIGTRKLLIYSDRSMQNPMNAAEITNSTGKTLDGGPITVFESGTYAGEALVETFKPNDKRLISYGVDLGTRITTNLNSSRDLIREFHASRGVLTYKSALQETLTYTIKNIDAKAKTLMLEHPIRAGYKFLNRTPVESTATSHRFEVKLAANANEKFDVKEEVLIDESISVSSLTPDRIAVFIGNKNLTAAGRLQLEAIASQKRMIVSTDAQIRQTDNDTVVITKDQERLRQNINSLNNVAGQQELVNRYAKDLANQESKLAALRDKASELRKLRQEQEQALNSLIEKISF